MFIFSSKESQQFAHLGTLSLESSVLVSFFIQTIFEQKKY